MVAAAVFPGRFTSQPVPTTKAMGYSGAWSQFLSASGQKYGEVAQICNLPYRRIAFCGPSDKRGQPNRAERLECEQLAAALPRHWISAWSAALDRLATFDSGSKLLALQTLRAIS